MTESTNALNGLTPQEAEKRQAQYGKNELVPQVKQSFLKKIFKTVAQPMFLLLLVAATIYFILGEPRDGIIMLIFVVGIISIDVIQEWKTDKTLDALKDLSAPHATVIRGGTEVTIASADIVPGDLLLLEEGMKIPADGAILKCNDFAVEESSLTGEPEAVWKIATGEAAPADGPWRKDYCYAGTLVTQGTATVEVNTIGAKTEYGKIGANIAAAPESPTPLQNQTGRLVKVSAIIAAVLFVLVGVVTFFNTSGGVLKDRVVQSVLSGVTLAMAMIPEEFPVILTVFLSMGAWRLARKQSLVRRLPAVETLGAVSVLCVDKTGTITMNKMTLQETWAPESSNEAALCEVMGLACETEAYDPMEKAMLDYCEGKGVTKQHLFAGRLITEYAFTNETKMMGHVWHHDGEIIIAAKGSAERILPLCTLTDAQRKDAEAKLLQLSQEGLRVIAVASMKPAAESEIPKTLNECRLTLNGLVGLADPPREGVAQHIAECTKAGIRVVMITGDNGVTAASIAKKIGMPNADHIITGDEINKMDDAELREKVKDVSIFSRVIPEHKMRIVKAFKDNGEVVAMTGDGVNDAPALKHADIGIAMGKRGSEVSREAADLILLDDNFGTIVDTIEDGRRIYDNIRKAVGYVFTIHIPIAFASLLAPMLGIPAASLLLLPLHVVLLELIIDPTCSIVLERQPAEEDIMRRPPRSPNESLLNGGLLAKSIIQGLVMFAASFGTYYFLLKQNPENAALARSMGLAVIMLANLFLVLVSSSNTDFIYHTIRRLSHDKVMWAINIGTLLGLAAILYTPLNRVLKLAAIPAPMLLAAVGIAAASVLWYELVKLVRYLRHRRRV